MSDFEVGKPRLARKSPLAASTKLCPKCLQPLRRGGKFGGWLIPQDYYCPRCGYRGTLFLEKSEPEGEK